MEKTSSARRLHDLLAAVCRSSPNNQPAWKAWATILVHSSDEEPSFFSQLPKLWELQRQVRSDCLSHYEGDCFPLSSSLDQIDILLRPSEITQPLKVTIDRVTREKILWGLESLAFELERKNEEVSVSQSVLDEVKTTINKIVDEVSAADDLDSELRLFLVSHLTEVREAIIDYRILGIEAILGRIQRSAGAIVLSSEVRAAGGPENSSVRRAVEGLAAANEVIEQSNKLIEGGKLLMSGVRTLVLGVGGE